MAVHSGHAAGLCVTIAGVDVAEAGGSSIACDSGCGGELGSAAVSHERKVLDGDDVSALNGMEGVWSVSVVHPLGHFKGLFSEA